MDEMVLHKIEEAALNAWPAPRQMIYDGWLLRFAGGQSKRINSVTPLYTSTLPLAEKISTCEAIYASQGQPCLFRLCETESQAELQQALKAAGYTRFDPTHVLGRRLEIGAGLHPEVTILEMPDEDWFRLRANFLKVSSAEREVHAAILNSIVPVKVLVGLLMDGQPAACGMGVVQGSLLGCFSIYTAARWRRKGFAGMVMAALAEWGLARGADFAYLQVEGHNAPALALYDKLGYTRCYTYAYYLNPMGGE
jgi:N-acetylglutamate synthase